MDGEFDDLYQRTAKGALFNYVAANAGILLQFLVTLVLIKFLPVDEFGIYSLFFSTVTFLGLVSGAVLYALARFIPDYMAKKNYRSAKDLFGFSVKLTLANGLLVLVLLGLFPGVFNAVFKSTGFHPLYVWLFAFINFVQLLTGVFDWTLNALLRQKPRAVMRVFYTGFVLVFAFLALSQGLSVTGLAGLTGSTGLTGPVGPLGTVLAVILASSLLTASIGFLSLKSALLDLPDLGAKFSDFKRVLRYGAFSQLSYLGELVTNLTIDNLLIGYLAGTTAIAWYSFGVKMPQVLMAYSPAVVSALVVFPSVVKRFTQSKNLGELEYFFQAYSRFTAFFVFPTLLGLVLLAPQTIQFVFDPKYLVAVNVFIVAAVSHGLLSFRHSIVNIYNTIERPEIGLYAKTVFLVTTAANVLLLQSGQGILTVALVNAAGFLVMMLLEFFLTRRKVRLRIPFRDLSATLAATLGMGLFVYLFRDQVHSLSSLLFLVLVAAGVYAAVSLYLKPFPRQDGQLFARIGRVGRFLQAFARPEAKP